MAIFGIILYVAAVLCGLGSLVCWILVLIKIFKSENNGVLHGIIGIICSLWALIWGWVNRKELGAEQLMIYWTLLILGAIVFQIVGVGLIAAGAPGGNP